MKWDPKIVKLYNLGRRLTKEEKIEIEKTTSLLTKAVGRIDMAYTNITSMDVQAGSRERAISFFNEAKKLIRLSIRNETIIENSAKALEKYTKYAGTNLSTRIATAEETILLRIKKMKRINLEIIKMIDFAINRLKGLHKVVELNYKKPISKERDLRAKYKIEILNATRRMRLELVTLTHNLQALHEINEGVSRVLNESEYRAQRAKDLWN